MHRTLFKKLLFIVLISFSAFYVQGQMVSIKGKVIDSSNQQGLALASIKNDNGKTLGITSNDGSFNVKVAEGVILTFSYEGYRSIKIPASTEYMTVVMSHNDFDKENKDVVVVAMDIKRNARELGYSTQTVSGDDIQQSQRQNFITSLQGRVAGLQINPTSGMAGASAQIVLRGFNSLSLNNQPLFVIDGVIVDNSTFNEDPSGGTGIGLASATVSNYNNTANRGGDYNNRISDINPNDIASVTVLKGPEATAIYGSQAGSGAIIITTKKAQTNGKLQLNYNNSFQLSDETRTAPENNDFSPGVNGVPSASLGGSYYSYFGPAYPANTKRYDNINNFFRTGLAQTHNLSANVGTQDIAFRVSGTLFDQSGIMQNNTYKKGNITIANTTKIGKYITISPSISYSHSNTISPLRGVDGALYNLYIWPSTDNAKNYLSSTGDKRTLYYFTNPNLDIDNPFWFIHNAYQGSTTNRYIATMGIDIRPFSWLALTGRFGYDTYKQNGFEFLGPETYLLTQGQGGSLNNYYQTYKGYNHTINLTANKKFGKLSTKLMVGTMWQDYKTQIFSVGGTNLIDSSASATDSSNTLASTRVRLIRNYYGQPNVSEQAQIAYYGEAVLGYNNVIFLDFTQRFESSSVFPAAYRNYNYPGLSLSAILSDIIPGIKSQNGLTFAKLRASVAKVAHIAPAYSNQSVFIQNYAPSASSLPVVYSYNYTVNNPLLQPEFQKTYDLGMELRFLNDRISFNADYYNYHNTNQIIVGFRASYATGGVLNTMNAANSRVQGTEFTLGVEPIRTKNWDWNMQYNFSKTWSKVLSLPASIPAGLDLYYSDTWVVSGARSAAVTGYPVTELTGYSYQRNDKGQILIDPTSGLPLVNTAFTPIGDRNPDFTLGFTNNLSYKQWNLSMVWDLRVGGAILNGTDWYLASIGRSPRTADRMLPRVVKGVLADGLQNTDNPTANTIMITPYYNNNYYKDVYGTPEEEFLQKNVNALSLRDITLSYTFNNDLFKNLKRIKSLTAFITCNNLLLITNYRGADPYVSSNTASGGTPGGGGIGGFGIDYFTPAAPVMYNLGIRLNF